eukprot:gene39121-51493_t
MQARSDNSAPMNTPTPRSNEVVIATRESRLALWQAEHVRDRLGAELGLPARLLGMTTRGDQILDRSLSKVGGKGLFVKELETALESGEARLAVHSLKDVPMDLPEGFTLAAILEREDPRDAFVSNHFADLAALPEGACVGTSSLRRIVQIKSARPDIRIEPLRGNLDTRLRKLDEGGFDAIVLDLVMPDVSGTEGVARMLQVAGATPVLVISFNAESAFAARLLQMGIAGYLPKAMAATELAVALQRLLQGKRYVTASMADHLVDLIGGRTGDRPVHESLSVQEHRVMLLIADGMPPAQIAELMHLSAKTVGTYRARIFEKTGWKSNVELSKYCLQHGLTSS